MLSLTDQMNRLLLLTPVHLHPATFSHHETQYVRRVLCKLYLQHRSKHLQKPDGHMSKWTILSLYNITEAGNLDKIIDF